MTRDTTSSSSLSRFEAVTRLRRKDSSRISGLKDLKEANDVRVGEPQVHLDLALQMTVALDPAVVLKHTSCRPTYQFKPSRNIDEEMIHDSM